MGFLLEEVDSFASHSFSLDLYFSREGIDRDYKMRSFQTVAFAVVALASGVFAGTVKRQANGTSSGALEPVRWTCKIMIQVYRLTIIRSRFEATLSGEATLDFTSVE